MPACFSSQLRGSSQNPTGEQPAAPLGFLVSQLLPTPAQLWAPLGSFVGSHAAANPGPAAEVLTS